MAASLSEKEWRVVLAGARLFAFGLRLLGFVVHACSRFAFAVRLAAGVFPIEGALRPLRQPSSRFSARNCPGSSTTNSKSATLSRNVSNCSVVKVDAITFNCQLPSRSSVRPFRCPDRSPNALPMLLQEPESVGLPPADHLEGTRIIAREPMPSLSPSRPDWWGFHPPGLRTLTLVRVSTLGAFVPPPQGQRLGRWTLEAAAHGPLIT